MVFSLPLCVPFPALQLLTSLLTQWRGGNPSPVTSGAAAGHLPDAPASVVSFFSSGVGAGLPGADMLVRGCQFSAAWDSDPQIRRHMKQR